MLSTIASHVVIALALCSHVFAARPFLNSPDIGIGPFIPSAGNLVNLSDIWGLQDFEASAQNFMNATAFTWIQGGVGGEYSLRNNLEVFPKVGFRPRMLVSLPEGQNTSIDMSVTILGYKFSAPFFVSPAAAPAAIGGYVPPGAEGGILNGTQTGDILYIPAMYAEQSITERGAAINRTGQVVFQQFYAKPNMTFNAEYLKAAEASGAKAIVWTIDAPADGPRISAERYTLPASRTLSLFTWDTYKIFQNMTSLPIIPKGILTVEDARQAVAVGAPAIILSNHGARHIDTAPSALQAALRIRQQAPEIFNQTEVLADGGVRYGTDVLKFLSLGVKAVGLGRTFLYANCYGQKGVEHAIQLLKNEIFLDAANLGIRGSIQEQLVGKADYYADFSYLNNNPWGVL